MDWVAIGGRIRKQREYLGLTREQFAEKLDITPKFCADIELGTKGMSVPTLCRIATTLSLSTDYILFGKQEKNDKLGMLKALSPMVESVTPGQLPYLESILKGYKLMPVPENPELRTRLANHSLEELTEILSRYKILHNSTDVDTVKRAIRAIEIEEYYAIHPVPEREFPALNSLIIGVDIDRELRREKITRRLKQRLEEGMVDEVRRLIEQGISPDDLIYYGLEYKYLTLYVIGKLSYEEMFNGLEIAIHQFAKRQMTWFRGMERRGFNIHWVNATLPMEEKIAFVKEKLKEI